ncbi:PDZ domain-containing protein [Paenibacillus sp. y28]|uniref:PDZ domain-containing protein n=1 Tax=Paenibacillus sp. y28 TaxID=3129110 RepID=UPI003018AE80
MIENDMDLALDLLWRVLFAFFQLLTQPFYYIGLLLIILKYRRQIFFERKLFATKLHSLVAETWRTILWGALAGVAVSLPMAYLGAVLQPEAVLLLWGAAIVLVLLKIRFLCMAYAAGLLGVLHALVGLLPQWAASPSWLWLTGPLERLHVPSLLALAALLHLAEALLVRLQGAKTASPLFFSGKRGKIVGGYTLQGWWPVPLFLLVPLPGAVSSLPWEPLFGSGLWSQGWAFVAFPVVIGFAERTVTRLPQIKARKSARLLFVYGMIVLGLSGLVQVQPLFTIGASLLTVLLHELMIAYSKWEEREQSPLFVHDARGLKILAVLPGSPAEEMGLLAGEIIEKANGHRVRRKEDLHLALQQNSAFSKLEVLNLAGHTKFVQRAVYAGEHHQLGILLAPDEQVPFYAEFEEPSVFAFLKKRLSGLKRNSKSM